MGRKEKMRAQVFCGARLICACAVRGAGNKKALQLLPCSARPTAPPAACALLGPVSTLSSVENVELEAVKRRFHNGMFSQQSINNRNSDLFRRGFLRQPLPVRCRQGRCGAMTCACAPASRAQMPGGKTGCVLRSQNRVENRDE